MNALASFNLHDNDKIENMTSTLPFASIPQGEITMHDIFGLLFAHNENITMCNQPLLFIKVTQDIHFHFVQRSYFTWQHDIVEVTFLDIFLVNRDKSVKLDRGFIIQDRGLRTENCGLTTQD